MNAVVSGLGQYISILRDRWKSLLFLALILHFPFLVQTLIYPVSAVLPFGLKLLLEGFLILAGVSLIACGPVFFLQNLSQNQAPGVQVSIEQIRSLGWRGVWNILLVLSFVHLCAMTPVLLPVCLMLVPVFFYLGLILTLVYLPVWIVILTFLGFSLHQYYFIQEVSMKPLKASLDFVRNNLWVVLGVYLVSLLIRLGLYIGFGTLKTLSFLWTLGAEVSRPGTYDGFSDILTKAQSTGLTPDLLQDVSSRLGVFFEPSLIGAVEGVAGEFFLTPLWAFFFLYIRSEKRS